jgi:hypothetical protein
VSAQWIPVKCEICAEKARPEPFSYSIVMTLQYFFVLIIGFIVFLDPSFFYISTLVIGWLFFDFIQMKYIPLVKVTSKKDGLVQD